MGSESLQSILAKAENSQAFQNQHLLLDRSIQAQTAESQLARVKAAAEQVQTAQESENPEVDPDQGGGNPRRRRRRPKKDAPAEPRRPPQSPNGEGSLIDIVV